MSLGRPVACDACGCDTCHLKPGSLGPFAASLKQRRGPRVGPVRCGKSCKPHQFRSQVCFLFRRHSLCSISRATFRKYANTLTAYEGNTGSRHPLDMRSRSSSTGPPKRASSGTVDRHNQEADLYGARSIGMPPQDSRGETSSIRTVFLISSPSISGHRYG